MTAPDFLIIGAAKSGTTSLYYYMNQHPQLFMPTKKEPAYFAYRGQDVLFQGPGDERRNATLVSEPSEYASLFQDAAPGQLTGEASVVYLYSEKAPECIRAHNPLMKMIVVLREPVARAVSNFNFMRTAGYEPCENIADALRAEPNRIRDNWQYIWHYSRLGFYGEQLSRYYEFFSPEQLLIIKHEELKEDAPAVLRRVFDFLGVDSSVTIDTSYRHNRSGQPKSMLLHRAFLRPRKIKRIYRALLPQKIRHAIRNRVFAWNVVSTEPVIDEADLVDLRSWYAADILKLQDTTGLDFSNWLATEQQVDSGGNRPIVFQATPQG